MAPNPANPNPTLAAPVTAGPTVYGSVGSRDVRLSELPGSFSTFISAYLLSLNKDQLPLVLHDHLRCFMLSYERGAPTRHWIICCYLLSELCFRVNSPVRSFRKFVDTCSVLARTVMMQAPRISFTGTSSSTSLVCGPQFNRGRKTDELLAPRCCSGHRPRCCSGRRPRCCPTAAPLSCQHAHLVLLSPSSPKSAS